MKRALSGLDLIALEREMQTLVDSRIDKVYHPQRDEVVITVNTAGEGKIRLRSIVNGWLWISRSKTEMPTTPTSFASLLRKHISNARITAIEQHGCDRIIEMVLQRDREYHLIFELFGEGNLLLVTEGKIVAVMRHREWKHRVLRPGNIYAYPPDIFDPKRATRDEFEAIMHRSDADLVRTLATKINLGGEYAEEICKRAGVEKNLQISEASTEQMDEIWRTIGHILSELAQNPSPHIVLKGARPTSISPIRIVHDNEMEIKTFEAFSEAIEEYVASVPREPVDTDDGSGRIAKVERTLETQEKAIEGFKREIDESQAIAEFIFAHYAEIEKILDRARMAERSDDVPDEIEIVDRAKGSFRTEIAEKKLLLSLRKGVTENAQAYYDKIKKLRAKLNGAEAAVYETRKTIEELRQEEFQTRERAKKKARRGRASWFERYRWFVSSEGAIVVAGRDAKNNDQLVKKHLEPGDRYVHADLHGAPSVIVKSKEGMTEHTLREAAIFSLAMSKAWNAGIGSGSAYWVTPEQVSKTPQSGEFVPRGAFIIRGKRNYFEKLEIRLAIGLHSIDGDHRIMCGPVSAVAVNCSDYIEMEPGETPKERFAKDLSERFDVDIEEVQAALPSGKFRISGMD